MQSLRPYQTDCLDLSLKHYRAGINRQLAVLATGLGKTAIASNLRSHHGFSKRILFLVHMETLAVQAANAMVKWNPGLHVGVEMAGSYVDFDGFHPPQFIVASVPTLGRKGSDRIKRFDPSEFDAVIQDEAHIGIADSFKRVYDHFGLMQPNPDGPLFLGITATPNRSDGKGLRELFDCIVFDMGIQKGIADGWLCDLVGYRVNGKAQLDGIKTKMGDFVTRELEDAVNTPARNGIIVKEWYKVAYGKRTLVFTVDVQHALDLAAAFTAHGESAEAVWGDDPDRHDKIRRHKMGDFKVLCNCNVLAIGYDDPKIECIISAAPTKSELRYVQQIGRGTRISEGKDSCTVIDVVDNSSKHSLTTVATLLGLPKDLDLKGEKYSVAKDKLERIAKEFPTANIQDIKSLNDLKSIAENISLFQVHYPVEIKTLTELAWRQQGEGYWLPVDHGRLTLAQDLRGEWWTRGTIAGKPIEIHAQNLAGAFNLADRAILDSGNKALYVRDARWRDTAPSEKQVDLCRRLKIHIPAGANRGQVSAALDAHFAAKTKRPSPAPVVYHGDY